MEISDEIAACFQARTTAIFCGAGISFNSGIPIVSSLLTYVFEKLELNKIEQDLIFKSHFPFEEIIETILEESDISEIQEVFLEGEPNTNHILIAKLVKNGLLTLVYTTNFDTLIEKALKNEGLYKDEDYVVCSSKVGLLTIDWDDERPKLIKIHGCASEKQEMAITLSQLASNRYTTLRTSLLSKLFCNSRIESVLVLGYSCSDFDLTSIIETFDGDRAKIYFVDHSDEEKIEDVGLKAYKNPFKTYNGLRLYINTDELLNKLWAKLIVQQKPDVLIVPPNWESKIDRWFKDAQENSGIGFKHHIAARLLYAIGEFRLVIEHCQQAVVIAKKEGRWITFASEIGTMGLAYSTLRETGAAIQCYEKALPITRSLGYTKNICAQLQQYANVLHHSGKNKEAIAVFEEALEYTKEENNEFSVSNILGNMANAYNQTGQYLKARHSLEKALEISRRIGNLQAESSQLGALGTTYMLTGQFLKAEETYLAAIKIKRLIADKQNLCLLLANLTSVYANTGQQGKLHEAANECLKLAHEINNREAEMIVYANLANVN